MQYVVVAINIQPGTLGDRSLCRQKRHAFIEDLELTEAKCREMEKYSFGRYIHKRSVDITKSHYCMI